DADGNVLTCAVPSASPPLPGWSRAICCASSSWAARAARRCGWCRLGAAATVVGSDRSLERAARQTHVRTTRPRFSILSDRGGTHFAQTFVRTLVQAAPRHRSGGGDMYERSGQERGTAVQAVRERRVLPRRRRSANGPRPVRPLVSAVAVRPAEAERPQVPSGGRRVPLPLPGVRTLVRRPLPVPLHVPRGRAPFERLRRALAGLAVAAAAAAVVVSLGVLASSAAAVRVAEEAVRSPQSVVVTVGAERTPWEVA